ncbi:MAG: prefoldin subunit beta [Nanoarchaeota archaeon]|nr:prefoldin subunit beta [Nanoarchaeota archaeon]
MDIDKETREKIQELQLTEQNLQNFILQKQTFQVELNETISALEEIKKSEEEKIFKIIGQVMLKTKKSEITEELNKKKEIFELRIKSFEKQEKILTEKLEKTRKEIEEKFNIPKK